jgi:hypothetical protein
LTKVISDTPTGTLAFGETIITFYEFAQLDSGESSSSNTLSNSIPCVFNYSFVMGNQLTNKAKD